MSVRSLRRRLDAEGKTFHAIANDALATIALYGAALLDLALGLLTLAAPARWRR